MMIGAHMTMNVVELAKPTGAGSNSRSFEEFEVPIDCSSTCCGLEEQASKIPPKPGILVLVGKIKSIPFPQPLYIDSTNGQSLANLRHAYKYIQKSKDNPKTLNGLFLNATELQFCYFVCLSSNIDDLAQLLTNTYMPIYNQKLLSLVDGHQPAWS